jgi:hypothetical protein
LRVEQRAVCKPRARARSRFGAIILFLTANFTAAASTAAPVSSDAAYAPPTFWAYDFADSVGVDTHLLNQDSFYYQHFAVLKQKLLAARISHIRDGAMDQNGGYFDGDQAARFSELGRAGIRVIFVSRLSVSKAFVQGFPGRVSPAFEAWELPNELNGSNVPWVASLRSWMPVFREYVKGQVQTTYPIIGPSLIDLGDAPYMKLGDQSANIDFVNLHQYYGIFNPGTTGYGGAGAPPCDTLRYGSLAYGTCNAATTSPTKPVMITESGYGTDAVVDRTVTPEVQMKYVPRLLLLHMKAGIRRTYIYQFADYGNDGFGAFGLLAKDGAEKPAYRELSHLLNEMNDRGPSGPPVSLSLSLNGQTQDLVSAVFQKSDGSYRLVAWLEKPSYDTKANKPLQVPTQRANLIMPTGYKVRRLWTFDSSGNEQTQPLPSAPITFDVGDNLTILDIAADERPNPPTRVKVSG